MIVAKDEKISPCNLLRYAQPDRKKMEMEIQVRKQGWNVFILKYKEKMMNQEMKWCVCERRVRLLLDTSTAFMLQKWEGSRVEESC